MIRIGSTFAAIAAALLAVGNAAAADYPVRPIRMIVPQAPGSASDTVARLVASALAQQLRQQIVVDNRPGANTIIGAQFVAKAKPDGYTLMMGIDGTLVMNQFLYSKLPYDPFKDFAPISLVAFIPSVLEANINVPVNSVQDVIDQEKAKPGTFMIGISTPTSDVILALFNQMAGIKISKVPYKGGTTLITGLLAGDIPLGFESANVSVPQWRAGKIKILGTTVARRLANAPEIPPIADTLAGFDLGIWQSVVAPAGTPRDVIDRLHASLRKVMAMPDVRQKLLSAGIEPAISDSPEHFAAFMRSQAEVRGKVIKSVGLKID